LGENIIVAATAIAKLIEEMKTSSSAWIKKQPGGPQDFHSRAPRRRFALGCRILALRAAGLCVRQGAHLKHVKANVS